MKNFETTTKLFEESAELIKVIAHPVRLHVIKNLMEKGPSNVSTIHTTLNLPQSTVSQHLAKLKSMKVVSGERKGLEIYYSVASDKIQNVMKQLFA